MRSKRPSRALLLAMLPLLLLAASPAPSPDSSATATATDSARVGLPAAKDAWYVSVWIGGGFAGLVRSYAANSEGEGDATKTPRRKLSEAAFAELASRIRAARDDTWKTLDVDTCCDRERTTLTIERRAADGSRVTHAVTWVQAGRPIPQDARDVIAALRSAFPPLPYP